MKLSAIIGGSLGLFFALSVLVLQALLKPALKIEKGPILPETQGAIKEAVVQYVSGSGFAAGPVYRDFFPRLEPEVKVHVLVPDEAAFKEFLKFTTASRADFQPLLVKHPLTAWARDRWLTFSPSSDKPNLRVLLSPKGERGGSSWPERAGDEKIVEDLAGMLLNVAAERSELFFDAGDFATDSEAIFVSPSLITRNVGFTMGNKAALLKKLEQISKRKVVMLDPAPDHHVGMYMMPAGDGTVVVADPLWGEELLKKEKIAEGEVSKLIPGGIEKKSEVRQLYDSVAKQASDVGYRVIRIPSLHAGNGRAYVTYVNVLLDYPEGRKVVYMPSYNFLPLMNKTAAEVWEKLGYEVRPVDATNIFREGGTVHCLVNILEREESGA